MTQRGFLLNMVEAAGIEPASENPIRQRLRS